MLTTRVAVVTMSRACQWSWTRTCNHSTPDLRLHRIPQQPINNRPVGPPTHHTQPQQPYGYDTQSHAQYEQHMLPPSLSPSAVPTIRTGRQRCVSSTTQ